MNCLSSILELFLHIFFGVAICEDHYIITVYIKCNNSFQFSFSSTIFLRYAAMSMVTFILFAMSGCAVAGFYLFFTHPPDINKCHANVFYIGFIGVQCLIGKFIKIYFVLE